MPVALSTVSGRAGLALPCCLALLVACAEPADPPKADIDTEICLAALGDVPMAEMRFGGTPTLLEEGSEVGFNWAPQGGLYTPFLALIEGMPELYQHSDYEGQGRVWARWSISDLSDGYLYADAERSELLECTGTEKESHLAFQFDAEYFGEDPSNYGGMMPEELEGREVLVSIELGPHPEPDGGSTKWGGATYEDEPVEYIVSQQFEVTLLQDMSL